MPNVQKTLPSVQDMLRYLPCLTVLMIILSHCYYRIREEGTEEERKIEEKKGERGEERGGEKCFLLRAWELGML